MKLSRFSLLYLVLSAVIIVSAIAVHADTSFDDNLNPVSQWLRATVQ